MLFFKIYSSHRTSLCWWWSWNQALYQTGKRKCFGNIQRALTSESFRFACWKSSCKPTAWLSSSQAGTGRLTVTARRRGNPAGAKAAPGPALQRAGEQMYCVWEVMLKHGLRGACRIWCWFVCCKRWSWHGTRGGSVLAGWQWVLSLPGCSCCHQSHCQALRSQLLQGYCFASLCLIEMERSRRD